MKKVCVLVGSVALAGAAVSAVDVEKDIWFLADFDSPARMNGEAFLAEQNDVGFVPGKFGRGYYFYRETNNKLLPMAQFFAKKENFLGEGVSVRGESLSFKGGDFAIADHPTGIGYHWVGHDAGNTWSFYVKGAKGAKLTAWTQLTALDEKAKKTALKKYPDLAKNEQPDVVVTNTVELTGDWQRVQCYAVCDNRTGGSRKSSLRVRTSGPVEMNRFQLQVTGVYPFKGRFDAGVWVDGGRSARGSVLTCGDALQLASFPYAAGSCSFWVRNVEGVPEKAPVYAWSFDKAWSTQWGMNGDSFFGGTGGSSLRFKQRVPRKDCWSHVAVTWRAGRIAYYIDGQLVNELVPDEKKRIREVKLVPNEGNRGTFRVGAFGDGSGPTDAVLDDFAIFNRALDDGEIAALAAAKTGLASGSKKVLAENILFRTFFRDQDDARLRFRVSTPEAAEYTLVSRVADVESAPKQVALPAGVSYLEVPFDPALFRPGKYAYAFALKAKDGSVALERKGELTVLGRLGKDPFLFHSWGGMGYIHPAFMKTLGVNAYNIGASSKLELRKALDEGLFANIRYENGNEWFKQDFDWAKIREKTVKDLEFAAALPNWRSTLLNSEIYGSGAAKRAEHNPKYLAMVEKATGVKPDFTFGDAPSEVNFRKLGVPPVRGEIDHKACPTLETLNYVCGKGLPPILSNYETTKAIHSVKPVLVWSEPMWGDLTDSVDMGADWEYEYSTHTTLRQLRAHYSACRAFGKPYMPTLGGNYWPEQKGRHPTRRDKAGKPEVVDMAQGCDEVTIKTWMSLGAVPAHNLSWFGLNSWEYGVSNALKYASSPTNAVSCIAEADCAERYGARWRGEIAPAADLLRDMPNVQAKIAYLSLPEIPHAAGFWWGIAHYPNMIGGVMAKAPAAFDYIGRRELLSGEIEKYEYVVYPMSRVVYQEHAAALRKAAKAGVKIVLDSYATNRYENCVHLKDLVYNPGQWAKMAEPMRAWYTNVAEEVVRRQGAASAETDGKTSFTFEKLYKGVRYVVVVNDKRDEKPSFLNQFKTNDWYRVVGAPQEIVTTIRAVGKGAKVYLFNGRGRDRSVSRSGDEVVVRGEFAAAEGCVYCVYPQALDAPELSLEGVATPGKTATLVVRINDEDGKPAPGRQVVTLDLTDGDGVARDESGRYVVEDGLVRIPLRIAKDERPTGIFSKWKATVTDLTTGKSETLKLAIK